MVAALASACLPRFVLRRLADPSRPLLDAERDDFAAAVLFADLSGFTPLAESLALQGHEGAEALAALLNESVGPVADSIAAHGGDLVKFVGDAVIALWPAHDGSLAQQIQRAELCAREAAARLDARPAVAARLRLHAGIGAGQVSTILAGGFAGRWYSTVAGPGLQQAGVAAQEAGDGEVVLSAEAAAIRQRASATAPALAGSAPSTPQATSLPATAEASQRLRAFLPEALTARLDAGQLDWLAELRPITALFVSLHGFGEQAAEVLARVQETMAAMQPLVARFGGLLKEFTFDDKGCTVVAAFGAPPLAHEDNELRALRVAEELHGTLAQRGIASSIGIATGRALCGLVGGAQRREYTIVGSAMNRAARLLQVAGGNVVCDDSTRQATRGAVRFEPLGSAVLKGLPMPLEVYRASGQPAGSGSAGAAPVIGRQPEREQLASILAEFGGQAPGPAATRVVAIEGEAGIGKSRLAATLQPLPQGMTLIECRGDPVDSMTPYAAWRPAFRRLLEVDSIADPEALRQRVNRLLSQDPEDLRLAPLIGAVLPEVLGDNEDTGAMDGAARAENTRGLLLRVLCRAAGERRAVVLIEDAQYLDSASWQMLKALAEADAGALLVIVLRASAQLPEEYGELLSQPRTVRIQLRELDAQDTARLLQSCLGASAIQDTVAQFVRDRAGGHPLFVEHLGQTLLASGLVELDAGECRLRRGATDLAQAVFPDTVQGILRASIDRLRPSEQLTLKAASVIGTEFQLALLARVHPTRPSAADLKQDIDRLVALGILVARKQPLSGAFAFRQAIMQQVAYELLLFAQRRELHLAVARSWPASAGDSSAASLAHHYAGALDPASPDPDTRQKAAQYSARAGGAALHAGAYREATRQLQRALHWLGGTGDAEPFQLATLNRQLGDALSGLGDLGSARQHHERALALLGRPARRSALRTLASLGAASARQLRHRLRRPRPYSGAAHRQTLESVRAYERLAEIDFFENQPVQSLRWSLLGLNAAEACGTSPELARISASMAVTAGLLRLHGLARTYEEQAAATCAGITEVGARAWSAMAAALYRVAIGDWSSAEQSIDAARGLYQRMGHRRYWEASSYIKLMVLAHHHGRLEDSSALAAEVELSGTRSGNVQAEAWGLLAQAENALRQQRADKALVQLRRAVALIPQGIGRAEETRAHALLAWAYLAHGDRPPAAAHLREALARMRGAAPTTYYSLEAYAATARVAVALAAQHRGEASSPAADALAAEALKALHGFAKTFPIALPRALLIGGLRHWQAGAHDRSRALLHRSAAAAARLKMPYEQALAQAALGERLEAQAAEAHRRGALQLFDQLGIGPTPAGQWSYTSQAQTRDAAAR